MAALVHDEAWTLLSPYKQREMEMWSKFLDKEDQTLNCKGRVGLFLAWMMQFAYYLKWKVSENSLYFPLIDVVRQLVSRDFGTQIWEPGLFKNIFSGDKSHL